MRAMSRKKTLGRGPACQKKKPVVVWVDGEIKDKRMLLNVEEKGEKARMSQTKKE